MKAGDLLFQIDPRTYKTSLMQAKAQYDMSIDNYHSLEKQVEVAQAQIKVAQASVSQAKSTIKELEAQIDNNKAEFARQKELLPKKATSQKSVDRARANYEVSIQKREGGLAGLIQAQASLTQAQASLAEAQANLGAPGNENASIREAQASLEQAELNIEFTQVKAPVDGYNTNLNLRIGSQAVANQPVVALVDINSFWIDAYFKETLLGKMSKGNRAIVTLMTYSDSPFEGTVDSIGWGVAQQDGSTGFELLPTVNPTFEWIRLAQRIPVRIQLNRIPEQIKLRVGSTASVLIFTGTDPAGSVSPDAAK